ncbi:unnamed protein product [Closterium sp. Yama58-4]|nr:unnamed protein product [Closterium sp. Yama58-4]
MFDDPFDYGEDPDMEYGDLLSSGKQDAVDPRPPTDTTSNEGWLKFPSGHNPEIASLGLYIRDDVRSCAILVAGGVYENLLFFPVISLLKEKYPGVKIDVAAPPRGKQTYEINKNVRRAWVYDPEDPFVTPAEYTEFLGKLKNEAYDLVLSTRLAGLGHAMFLFLSDARQRVSYVNPNASGAGAGVFLSTAVRTEKENLAEDGCHMYKDLVDLLLEPVRGGPALHLPPLQVNLPRKVREVTREKTAAAGVAPGAYTLVHGVDSSSAASMRSRGDTDSALSLALLAEIAKSVSGDLLVVVPNDADQGKVQSAVPSAKIVKITTPGQLAAAIDDAAAVVTTNTAAVQLATALRKPSVALFGSSDKADRFVPNAADRNCTVVASATGTNQIAWSRAGGWSQGAANLRSSRRLNGRGIDCFDSSRFARRNRKQDRVIRSAVILDDVPHISEWIPGLQMYNNPLLRSPNRPENYFVDSEDVVCQKALIKTGSVGDIRVFRRSGPREQVAFQPQDVRAAIVTCGGLCPGLNTVIRELVWALWFRYGVRSISGIDGGYRGFYSRNLLQLDPWKVNDIHKRGGTFLGTSRGGHDSTKIVNSIEDRGINQLYIIGGDGTQRGAEIIYEETRRRGLKVAVAGIPKTIDNDIAVIDRSFGFDSAVEEAQRAISAARVEVTSTHRGVGLVKLMGRYCGQIAMHATLASRDVDCCLIPEVPFHLEGEGGLFEFMERKLYENDHCVIVVAEGAGQSLVAQSLPGGAGTDKSGNALLLDVGLWLSERIKEHFSVDKKSEISLKYIDPTYMIRAIPANAGDNIYCTLLAHGAIHGAMAGYSGFVVGPVNGTQCYIPVNRVTAPKSVALTDRMWARLLSSTSQPTFMRVSQSAAATSAPGASNVPAMPDDARPVDHKHRHGGHNLTRSWSANPSSATTLIPGWISRRVARSNDAQPSDAKAIASDAVRWHTATTHVAEGEKGGASGFADHMQCATCGSRMDASHMVASVSSAPQPPGLLHVSPRDVPVLTLGFVACSISAALSGIIFAAIPALLAVRRAAQAVERLATTAREELPGTMAAVRLSGMEISDLTMELSDLSHEISQGVRSPARASRLAASSSSARAKEQHTADALKDATAIPIRVVSPLFSSAAGAVGAAASTVGSTVSHVGGTVGAAASHVGGTVGAAASHVGAAASHVGGAAAHIPSVVFNLVDFLPWGHRRGGEGGENGGEANGHTADNHSAAATKPAAANLATSSAAPTDIPGMANAAAPATKTAAASATSSAAKADPHSSAPSEPLATARVNPVPSESRGPRQQTPEAHHHKPHHSLESNRSHHSNDSQQSNESQQHQQSHEGVGLGSHKAAGAGTTRQAVAVGAAAEEQFELSSLPSLVGWLQHRKDKQKHPKGDARGRDHAERHVAMLQAATCVHVGALVGVRGKVTVFNGRRQVTVDAVYAISDPNEEILHWLDCLGDTRRS